MICQEKDFNNTTL